MLTSFLCILILTLVFGAFAASGIMLFWLTVGGLLLLMLLRQEHLVLNFWIPLVLLSAVELSRPVRKATYWISLLLLAMLAVGVCTYFPPQPEPTHPRVETSQITFLYVGIFFSVMMVGFWAFYAAGSEPLAYFSVLAGLFSLGLDGVVFAAYACVAFTAWMCCSARVRTRNHFLISSLVGSLCVGAFFLHAWWQVDGPGVTALHEEYPIEDLQPRLAYEAPHRVFVSDVEVYTDYHKEPEGTLRGDVQMKVNEVYQHSYNTRSRSLKELRYRHEMTVLQFIEREGFGVRRIVRPIPPRRNYIELEQLEPIPFGTDPQVLSAEELAEDAPWLYDSAENSSQSTPWRVLHVDSIVDFVNPQGFGHAEGPELTLGFQGHGFRHRPKLKPRKRNAAKWQVVRLELISLLKYETPRVYVSESLPLMEELVDAPTRSLNTFESDALSKLQIGKELITSEGPNTARMLGAIRCIQECRQCHELKRGTLLGAFSYELRRVPAVPEKKPKHDPRVSLLLPHH